ncbi:terpene synthase family protein [Nocardia sp. CDC160]|uniref:terpene synthase family protein n=1 Tax=Nocardia sp. CDC160 TaxID=3112166 RepID=UPI002DB8448E|nr:terpene synthase family protein [Nocardia sp. CDC160]MEC3917509.1 terpene synthase family protein [Nocardia sp. CDC160]
MEAIEFFMPFDAAGVNPAEPEAESGMWSWLEAYDLVPTEPTRRRMERTRPARMYALWCPRADVEELTLLSRYTAWAFIVDDQFDIEIPDPRRCLEAITAIEAVLDGTPTPSGVLAVAFADLWAELCRGRSTAWRESVRAEIRAWLWTYYTESVGRISGNLPDLDTYRAHRRDGVALFVFLDISERAEGVDLSPAVRHLPAMRTLREAAVEHMGLFNDMLSVASDEASGYLYNSVLLAQYHYGHSRVQAQQLVNGMLSECVQRMLDAVERLPTELNDAGITGGERADTLVTARNYTVYVRANHDYHYQAARYMSAPVEALEHGLPLT